MAADDPSSFFASPKEAIDWAREAIDEFSGEGKRFIEGDDLRNVVERDPGSPYQVLKIKQVTKDIPGGIAKRATEALAHLRNSFDQSLFAACRALNKVPKKGECHFPWATNPKDLQGKLSGGKKGPTIPQELWPALCGFEPYPTGKGYPGGNDIVREMAKIANRKHTVRITLGVEVISANHQKVSGMREVLFPVPRWDPVKKEVILLLFTEGTKPDYDGKINFYIAFDELPPLAKQPVRETLHLFAEKAKGVCEGLEEEVIRLTGG